ncbi:MAG: ATP-binding protein [Alphaproteobacteria bacterium]|nr:ATP-binding protein [Alphaproteobacteria bacterium]
MIVTLLLWLSWAQLALAGGGAAVGERYLGVWVDGAGMAVYDLQDLDKPLHVFEVEGRVSSAVAWDDSFIAVVEQDEGPVTWRYLPERPRQGRLIDLQGAHVMAVDPNSGELLLIAPTGDTYRIAALEAYGQDWFTHKRQAPKGARLGVRTRSVLLQHQRPMVGVSEVGLHVARPTAKGAPRVAHGTGIDPVHEAAWVGNERLVSVGELDGQWRVTRWSLLHPWIAPWPFPISSEPLDAPVLDLISTPDGAWILADTPLHPLEALPGVWVGLPEGVAPPLAGVMVDVPGQVPFVALVNADLSVTRVAPPPAVPRSASPIGDATRLALGDWSGWSKTLGEVPPATQEVVHGLAHDDLPLGARTTPGGSMPGWIRSTVEQLIGMATPLNQVPLVHARAYLEGFDDPGGELRQAIEARTNELRGRTVTFWGGLMVAGSLAIWLWRWASRRTNLRDQVLASAWNPFRQDSPNNPSRTPFAANSLADDLLRTLDLNCVVVEGPQFSGKSALLRHVAWRLETEGLRGHPARVVRMSLFGIPEERFWTELGRGIAEAYPDSEVSEEIMDLTELDRGAVEYLLDEVLLEGAPRLVLVLDDLDALGLYQAEAQRFRGLLQVVPSHRMAVLGAGLSIRRGFAGDPDESPWFNLFQVRQLRPMSYEELLRYLDSRLQAPFSFSNEAAERLHALTEGRPLQIWHLCFAAIEHLLVSRRFELTTLDVEAASTELRALAGVFVQSESQSVEGAEDGGVADAAWERVVRNIAEARRRRAELLQLREERQQREAESAMDKFFQEDDPPAVGGTGGGEVAERDLLSDLDFPSGMDH